MIRRVLSGLAVLFVMPLSVSAAPNEEFRKDSSPKNTFSIGYEYEEFLHDNTEAWQLGNIDLGHKFEGFGSVIVRVNRADRFGRNGVQYEIDAYPKVGQKMYAYLNVGFSNDSLFPDYRYGAQLYRSLGNGWEGSIGFRYLKFTESTIIYTGSIGRYWGNWYATLTPYVVPDDIDGTSGSGALEFRYYRSSGDDYWTFRGSYGNAPDVDTLLQITNRLDSWSLGVGRQIPLGKKGTFLSGKIGYNDREYNVNVKRESVVVQVSLKHRF